MSKNVKDVIFLQSRAAKVDFYTKCDFVLVFYIAAFTCKLNWKYFQGSQKYFLAQKYFWGAGSARLPRSTSEWSNIGPPRSTSFSEIARLILKIGTPTLGP